MAGESMVETHWLRPFGVAIQQPGVNRCA
jgi:hypothetical protein